MLSGISSKLHSHLSSMQVLILWDPCYMAAENLHQQLVPFSRQPAHLPLEQIVHKQHPALLLMWEAHGLQHMASPRHWLRFMIPA
jgi:hypothetical protein